MENRDSATGRGKVNPGYALFQIAKALSTSEQHTDAATQKRAQAKISKWTAVINGMLNDTLEVGSRTPVEGVPGWVTVEVITGGFATGELLAGGPLLEHERALLTELARPADPNARKVLNAYHLTDKGLAKLQEQLLSGCYDVAVPEEAAFLVVAWLVGNGYGEEARNLLDHLAPFLATLRFYPLPGEHPGQFGSRVYLQNVGETLAALKNIQPNQHILAQKEAIQVWLPLYDEMVRLFLETVEGEMPNLRRAPDGKPLALQNGRYPLEGGWPCQNYPAGWRARAQELLDEYKLKRAEYTLCRKPERKDSLAQLYNCLRRCIKQPEALTGRDVGRIRLILARYIAKRGTPEASTGKDARQRQMQQAGGPTFHSIARVVISRLEAYPKERGLDHPEVIGQPITRAEAEQWPVAAHTLVPESQQKKISRCLCDTVDHLVEARIITSGETLARVLPQMTSEIRAVGIVDPTLRQVYAASYRAFRRRRSLLLLNLESQIKIEELPWVAAITRFRQEDLSTQELSKQTLEEITRLAIVSFPYAILPNKLLQELRALTKGANLDIPLVDEVAADIFMGTFTDKFLEAAKQAGTMLEGTLYEIYYGIDYKMVSRIPKAEKVKRAWFQRPPTDFVKLCSARAGVTHGGWDPAINGMIIEQQQIYTSQNLAVLFAALDLEQTLGDQLEELAQTCFAWICHRQQMKVVNWHARLIMVKNTAYAWRQMVFYLALLPHSQVQTFLVWADDYLNEQKTEFQMRFRPALQGLRLAAAGQSLDDPSINQAEARRFLGWSKQQHWLLD